MKRINIYRIFVISLIAIFLCTFISSCKKEETKRPYGAEDIDYNKIESMNSNGPVHEDYNEIDNVPFAEKNIFKERGPEKLRDDKFMKPPIASLSDNPDFGGIPVIKKVQ